MSVRKLLTFLCAANALALAIILLLSFLSSSAVKTSINKMVNRDQTLLLALNDMYAQGLQTGQATRNLLINPKDAQARENFKKASEEFGRSQELAGSLATGATSERLNTLKALWEEDQRLKREAQTLATTHRGDEAGRLLADKETPKWRELKNLLLDSINDQKKTFAGSLAATEESLNRTLLALTLVTAFFLAGLVGFHFYVSQRKIGRPLAGLVAVIGQVSRGDLAGRVTHEANDEIGALAKGFNGMVDSFRQMIQSMVTSAGQVVSAVESLRVEAQRANEGASSQKGQAAQIAAAAEQMNQTISEIAQNTASAAGASGEAMEQARRGKEIAGGAVNTVNRVHASSVQLGSMVEKLNARAGEIGNIVSVIAEIADQTNLLALNAAIEAARAGEHGKGFAVVAAEVRKLAEKTMKATSEISTKIRAVQEESARTATSMEEASTQVTQANEYIGQVGDALNSIATSVERVRDQMTQIATAVEQQSATSAEVVRNIETTLRTASEIGETSGRVMREVDLLSIVAEELRKGSQGFKVS
jgi:methyl-accepting chemotaxis protein